MTASASSRSSIPGGNLLTFRTVRADLSPHGSTPPPHSDVEDPSGAATSVASPDSDEMALRAASCPAASPDTDPDRKVILCDLDGTKYLLGPVVFSAHVRSASLKHRIGWTIPVTLDRPLSSHVVNVWADMANSTSGAGYAMAFVADSVVIATGRTPVPDGQFVINGTSGKARAKHLLELLR